jgi:hypothetical protein
VVLRVSRFRSSGPGSEGEYLDCSLLERHRIAPWAINVHHQFIVYPMVSPVLLGPLVTHVSPLAPFDELAEGFRHFFFLQHSEIKL